MTTHNLSTPVRSTLQRVGAGSAKFIAQELGVSVSAVRRHLNALVATGQAKMFWADRHNVYIDNS